MTMSDHTPTEDTYEAPQSIWMRGLFMLIFAIFFNVAQTLLGVMALVQFFWMLFAKEKNAAIADFGESLGVWLARVAEFQTGATEVKPFPWSPLGR
jgi:hypothetical protein